MKSLLEKLLKKDREFNYVMTEYRPISSKSESRRMGDEMNYDLISDQDEMAIDKLYQIN